MSRCLRWRRSSSAAVDRRQHFVARDQLFEPQRRPVRQRPAARRAPARSVGTARRHRIRANRRSAAWLVRSARGRCPVTARSWTRSGSGRRRSLAFATIRRPQPPMSASVHHDGHIGPRCGGPKHIATAAGDVARRAAAGVGSTRHPDPRPPSPGRRRAAAACRGTHLPPVGTLTLPGRRRHHVPVRRGRVTAVFDNGPSPNRPDCVQPGPTGAAPSSRIGVLDL